MRKTCTSSTAGSANRSVVVASLVKLSLLTLVYFFRGGLRLKNQQALQQAQVALAQGVRV